MTSEIVFTCNSTNNKNVRGNELKILRRVGRELYFEFGENENNIKKRYYSDTETLKSDFDKLVKIKEKLEKEDVSEAESAESVETDKEEEEKIENDAPKAKKGFGSKDLF